MKEGKEASGIESAKLQKLAKKKKYDELESAWESAVGDEANSIRDLLCVLEILIRQKETDQAGLLFWFLLTTRAERMGAEEGLDVARQGAALLSDSDDLREEVAALYRKVHGALPETEKFASITVLCKDTPLHEAVRRMDKFLALRPGTYVLDRSLQKIGCVAGLDEEEEALVISFEDEKRPCNAPSIDNIELLEDDNFRALVLFNRERLEELAQNNPVELVRITLKTFKSRLTFRELKSHLLKIMPASSWSKWWTNVKPQITHSAIIDMSPGTQPLFILRSSPVTYVDRLRARFDNFKSIEDKLVMVLDYLGETGTEAVADDDLLKHFAVEMAAYLDESGTGEPGMFLGALAVIDLVNKRLPEAIAVPEHSVETLFSETDTSAGLLRSIENDNLAKRVLEYLQQILPSRWHEVYAALMPECSRGVCDFIARELSKNGFGKHLGAVAKAIIKRPDQYASALVWLWNAAYSGKFHEGLAGIDRIDLLVRLLSVAQSLFNSDSGKKSGDSVLSQVRNAISARKYSLLEKVFEETGKERIKLVKRVVERNSGLGEQMRSNILDIIRHAHPSFFVKNVPPWEDDVIYTTQKGLQRKQEEFAHLVNVKMSDIAREIGKAAELGDLSENSEFTAALEWRERLAKRASEMQSEISNARLIITSTGPAPSVTIGSTVRAKDLSSGQVETFVFLGPWDADPDNGIYSYRASLARGFMGRKTGETVVLSADDGERKLELIEISGGIDIGQTSDDS